jgi:hypothetical protein
MKKRMSRIWSALPSQIYPELARLEAQGLATHYVVEQQDHRPRKCDRIATRVCVGDLPGRLPAMMLFQEVNI